MTITIPNHRGGRGKTHISDDELRGLYLSHKLTIREIAQRDGRRTFSPAQYAELVARVREHLGDTTDYSIAGETHDHRID